MDNSRGNFYDLGFDANEIELLEDAHNAIEKAGKWAFMSYDYAEFKDNGCPELEEITTHMKCLDKHSGASYERVMKAMSTIARDGWAYFAYDAFTEKLVKATKDIAPGDFGKLGYNSYEVAMLDDAYKAVTSANMWSYLANYNFPSFMYKSPFEINRIDSLMKYDGHSGSSYGWTMRSMETIAKRGWAAFSQIRVKRMWEDEKLQQEAQCTT